MSIGVLKKRIGKQPYNLVSLSNGKYLLENSNENAFWILYQDEVKRGVSNYYSECPSDSSIFKLDIDISISIQNEFELENNISNNIFQMCYDLDQVKQLIKIVHDCFLKYLTISTDYLECFLLEKSGKIIRDDMDDNNNYCRIKRGFHLHWPLFVLRTRQIQKFLITKIIEQVELKKVFPNIKCPIDKNSFDIPWLFYGCKKPDIKVGNSFIRNEPYEITKAYDYDCNEFDYQILLNKIKLVDSKDDQLFLPDDICIARKMMTKSFGRKCFELLVPLNLDIISPNVNYSCEEITNDNCKEIEMLLNLLNFERCIDYIKWINVGRCLFNIFSGSKDGLSLFIKWSEKYPEKFSLESCNSKWNSFSKSSFGILLLKSWAKNDNPKGYSDYKLNHFSKNLNEIESYNDRDLAKLCKIVLNRRLNYCETDSNWYIFNAKDDANSEDYHKWSLVTDAVQIKILMNKVLDYIEKIKIKIDKEKDKDSYSKILKIVSKFSMLSSKNNICTYMKEFFSEKDFSKRLDTIKFLICFKNGVFDFEECIFRNGIPEDMISLSIPCNYNNYSETDEEIKEVRIHMMKFFPDPNLRNFMYDLTCQTLIGNFYTGKKIFFFIGPKGDNGKTMFSKWLEIILGSDFFITLPTAVLTKDKGKSNEASPHLVRIKNKKVIVFSEPEVNEQINIGILKTLTGNDSIQQRDLFQAGKKIESFTCDAIIFFISNNLPLFKDIDAASLKRIVSVEWNSEFIKDGAPATFEEQMKHKIFPATPDFEKEMKRLKNAFVWILIDHWKNNKKRLINLSYPEIVKQKTLEYKNKLNILKTFILQVLEKKDGENIGFVLFKTNFLNYLISKNISTILWDDDSKIKKELTILSIETNSENQILNYNYKNE